MAEHTKYRPKDCRYCYYWKKSAGCTHKGETGCYYEPKRKKKTVSECDNCPYGRCGPCIGWCTKEVMRSLGLPRERECK